MRFFPTALLQFLTRIQMIRCYVVVFLLFASLAGSAVEQDGARPALMPVPAQIEWTGDKFRLDESFLVGINGQGDARLYPAATRALRRLSERTGLFFSQDFLRPDNAKVDTPDVQIEVKRPGKVAFGEDESYQLSVTESGIKMAAETDIGILRGLETLLQLLAADENGYYLAGVQINDVPRFPWRGLLIDACRHFMPVAVIKRNLDGMAAVKLNVLHWHLSEDQGFRVESKVYPKLHEKGSDGFYYTQAQIKDVIAYADARGIRVAPEFDVPGHATSWVVAYPELGSAPGPYEIERNWGIFYPVLNPANEFTYEFLDKFFGEMAALFPDPYFHIGGDEIEHGDYHEAKHWNENEKIQAFMKKHNLADNAALQAYFNQRILKILTQHKKIMVGWDEILHDDMPTNIVIQSWRGRESMEVAAQKGYRSILSNGYYIDLIQPTDFHYLNDPLPADLDLSDAEKDKILGGEATMWAEHVTPETVDSRIWPRTAAIAERFWSPGSVNDVPDMYRRLETIRFQLEEHGLTHEKNYPMLLRRLTGNQDIKPLKTLVDVLEPVKIYRRNGLRKQTSFSPYTRVVDAARPDAKVAREFRNLVDAYLAAGTDGQSAEKIAASLQLWRDNHAKLEAVIRRSPVLWEIEPVSQTLADISQIGLNALGRYQAGKTISPDQLREIRTVLEQAKESGPHQTELMVVSAIEKLVEATAPAN